MGKSKLNNMLGFVQYGELNNKKLKKQTKRTDIGGDVLNENIEALQYVASLINDTAFMDSLKTFVNALSPVVKSKLYALLKRQEEAQPDTDVEDYDDEYTE